MSRDTSESGASPSRLGELVCHNALSSRSILRFSFETPKVLGRDESADLRIPDVSISRHHCRFEPVGDGEVRVIDLGSSNGTLVNGVHQHDAPLRDGDRLMFGVAEFEFHYVAAEEASRRIHASEQALKSHASLSVEVGNQLDSAVRLRFDTRQVEPTNHSTEGTDWALRGLKAVCGLAEVLRSENTPMQVLDAALDAALELTGADRAAAVVRDRTTRELSIERIRRRGADADDSQTNFPISQTVVNEVLARNESLLVYDAQGDDRFKGGQSVITGGLRGILCVPLGISDGLGGALYLDTTRTGGVFSPDEIAPLSALAHQAGVAFERARLVDDLQRLFVGAMRTMVLTLEARDSYTRGHAGRVMLFALQLADQLGVDPRERDAIELGGLMHDVGKVGVLDSILTKPDRLSPNEYDCIKRHPEIGAAILKGMPNLDRIVSIESVIQAVLHHHERLDGRGYPSGLSGNRIPRAARILAIADVWDALTSDRPYRPGLSVSDAWEVMVEGSGLQFDAEMLNLFGVIVHSGKAGVASDIPTRFGLE